MNGWLSSLWPTVLISQVDYFFFSFFGATQKGTRGAYCHSHDSGCNNTSGKINKSDSIHDQCQGNYNFQNYKALF